MVHPYITTATLVVDVVLMVSRVHAYVRRLYGRHSFPVCSALTNKVADNKLTQIYLNDEYKLRIKLSSLTLFLKQLRIRIQFDL